MTSVFSVSIKEARSIILLICVWNNLFGTVIGKVVINYSPLEIGRGEMINYFRAVYQSKISSRDETNEAIYNSENFAEDLYHNVDNLMPLRIFQKLLVKTKNITDKYDGNGLSMLSKYPATLNAKCSKDSIFDHTLHEILQRWDGDKTIIYNDIDQWHRFNALTPYNQICNRFVGLTCQFKWAANPDIDNGKSFEISEKPTCQCAGDSSKIGFYKHLKFYGVESYPDGCYVRLWKQCRHLSLDTSFKSTYHDWHINGENWRRQLAQIVFPVARTHRCKEGTYCVDIVPGMKKPICYCRANSNDEKCKQIAKLESKRVPVGRELTNIRRAFVKLILSSNDTVSLCNPEYNEEVLKISETVGHDPTATKVLDTMKQLAFTGTRIRICDFREGILCDGKTSTCKGNLNCDHGKIHLGMGVCAVNNGFPCQTNEECIENAKCRKIGGGHEMICMCEKGYGHLCELEKPAFFTKRFLPIISGFQGDKFIKLQTDLNRVIETWEDTMTVSEGESCNSAADLPSMAIVKYFGNLELYDKEKGDILLKKLKEVLQPGPRLCNYFNFLHCDAIALKCLPMLGSRTVSSRTSTNPNEPHVKIMIELEVEKPCDLDTPLIFKDRVVFACSKGYACMKTREGKICAPDCNSIYAPLEACPPVPTTLMTEEPELETSTLAPHNVPETTFPTEEIGRNDIDGTMLEGNKEKGSEPDDTDLDESLGSKNQDADESVGSENQDVDESVGSKTQDIEGDLDEAQETAKMYSTDENEVATVDSDPNDDSVETGRADPETNAPTPAPTTTTTTTTTPTTNTPTTTTSTTDTTTTITTTKTEAPTSTANPTTKQPTESTPVATTESTTVTTTETTTESTTQTIRTTRAPEHKRTFGEECRRNDSRAVYPQNDKHLICDSALFLVCLERQCRCLRGLAYAQHLNKCAIPIGERCSPEIWRKILPIYMDSMNLPCQYGVCKKDNVGKICRPESDRGLILVG